MTHPSSQRSLPRRAPRRPRSGLASVETKQLTRRDHPAALALLEWLQPSGRSPLKRITMCADCRRRLDLEHSIAVRLRIDGRLLVSVVLNRRGLDLSARDCERLEGLRPLVVLLQSQSRAQHASLTPRENEVLHWLSQGKTDAQIAALLGLSPRTVQKHLEHVYVKLGVETRMAAVMRMQTLQNAH